MGDDIGVISEFLGPVLSQLWHMRDGTKEGYVVEGVQVFPQKYGWILAAPLPINRLMGPGIPRVPEVQEDGDVCLYTVPQPETLALWSVKFKTVTSKRLSGDVLNRSNERVPRFGPCAIHCIEPIQRVNPKGHSPGHPRPPGRCLPPHFEDLPAKLRVWLRLRQGRGDLWGMVMVADLRFSSRID